MTRPQTIFLTFLRAAVGNADGENMPQLSAGEWRELTALSFDQGLHAVALDGYNLLMKDVPKADSALESEELFLTKYEWYAGASETESGYEKQMKVIRDLADLYSREGIKMMILKGYGLSLCYPVPVHRNLGDIDIYLFGQWKRADAGMRELGIKVDESHHHHSVFKYKGQCVENHFDFINVHSHLSGRRVERRLKALAAEPGEEVMPNVYLPSPYLGALFTLRHAAAHFASGELVFRQMLDWMLLVRSYEAKIDWTQFWEDVRMMGMMPFALALAAVATDYLGFDAGTFHLPDSEQLDRDVSRRIVEDTLCGSFKENPPKGFLRYLRWMLRRWWASRWKHSLVYTDSLFSTFVVQIFSHLLRPASLK